MDLVRWNPWRELEDISSRLNAFFMPEGGAGNVVRMTMSDWNPRVDITENAEEFVVTAELPGVERKNVKIDVNEGTLSISGEKHSKREEKGEKTHRVERSYGRFCRKFSLPDGINENKIVAENKDGLVYVHLPKSPGAKTSVKEIRVK